MSESEQLTAIRQLALEHFGKHYNDDDARDCLLHINHLVRSGAPSTTKTLVLGIKKKMFADIINGKA